MKWRINEINFLIFVAWAEHELLHRPSVFSIGSPTSLPPSAHVREIRKLISFIRHSMYLDSVCNRSFKFKMGFGIGFVTMKEMFSTTFKPLSNHFYRGYNHCRNHSLTNDNMNTYIIISLIKYIHEYS